MLSDLAWKMTGPLIAQFGVLGAALVWLPAVGASQLMCVLYNPVELAQQNKPIWFVIDSENVWFAPDAHKQWMENNANLLFVWYLRVREQIDMKVYLYQPTKNPDE